MSSRFLLPLIAGVLVAAAPVQPTLGPPVTGSMYNGNNLQAPKLTDPADLAPVIQSDRDIGGTQTMPGGGQGASHGGAG